MDLTSLGWGPCFAAQIETREDVELRPWRVMAIHRTGHVLCDGTEEREVRLGRFWFRRPPEERPTVGDWVLVDAQVSKVVRCLKRSNVLRRVAAGSQGDVQLIGANVDKLFVVTSCNAEFSTNRLQRYLTLAAGVGVDALVVLTKADLAQDPEAFRSRVEHEAPDVPVEVVNALDSTTLGGVRRWLGPGRTVALLGSSGVGKSTMLNTLAGSEVQTTRPIREQDAKGRHTTTSRSLNRLPDGTLVLDGPGMRELGVVMAQQELEGVYDDIEEVAARCRFANCRHDTEPDCAIREEIEAGRLEANRVNAYFELVDHQRSQQASMAQRRRRSNRLERRRRSP